MIIANDNVIITQYGKLWVCDAKKKSYINYNRPKIETFSVTVANGNQCTIEVSINNDSIMRKIENGKIGVFDIKQALPVNHDKIPSAYLTVKAGGMVGSCESPRIICVSSHFK